MERCAVAGTTLCSHYRLPFLHHPLLKPSCFIPSFRFSSVLGQRPLSRSLPGVSESEYKNMNTGMQKWFLQAFRASEIQGVDLNDEVMRNSLLISCGKEQECLLGGIVALGKFDALHIGHRQLVICASEFGTPCLLSFVGIAEVLGWEPRLPVVAKMDRKRVLSLWGPYCGNIVPSEYEVQFSKVRCLTPRQFVERLSNDLKISGVVAGENYRFGYKALGDAAELVRLCEEFGLSVQIVPSVMDNAQQLPNGVVSAAVNSRDKGQVSSSRIRDALANGKMEYVTKLLGRRHRLVLTASGSCCSHGKIHVPKSSVLNQHPADGMYDGCTLVVDNISISCRTVIQAEKIAIESGEAYHSLPDLSGSSQYLEIEFT